MNIPMKKLLIITLTVASGFLGACSEDPIISNLPGIYRLDVKQGNVVTQESLNQLRPGMSRKQVRYILGTPLVVDVFHQNRWDYFYYDYLEGDTESGKNRISVYFDDDKLSRIDGDMRPGIAVAENKADFIVEVPPQKPEDVGIITEALSNLGILGDEEEALSPTQQSQAKTQREEKGFIQKTLDSIGLGDDEETDQDNASQTDETLNTIARQDQETGSNPVPNQDEEPNAIPDEDIQAEEITQ